MDVQLKRGLLDICVIKVLQKEDSYGYKIVRDLSAYMKISESTLYPILKRLEQNSCLTVYMMEHNGRLRKYYRITGAGKQRIADFMAEWDEVERIVNYIKGGTEHE
ncbi:MAG: PadR family transcriptional regulator [Firmicutes bacterium]|nr:PadR family transcriptional regulator [Bacillota bacterium]